MKEMKDTHNQINSTITAHVTKGFAKAELISDGYHTFGDLYDHRHELFMALCRIAYNRFKVSVWKSKFHSDGTSLEGQFILGMFTEPGKQITYHLPLSKWDEAKFPEVDKAPKWDGHRDEDVLTRLKAL